MIEIKAKTEHKDRNMTAGCCPKLSVVTINPHENEASMAESLPNNP